MRVLDLDLDFFLDDIAYPSGDGERLGPEYRPWSVSRVRHFLEKRCGLSRDAPVPGCTVETHDKVFDFWLTLVSTGGLKAPFEVVHVDAHPDLWVGGGLHLASGSLHMDPERRLVIRREDVHPGNYLTYAIACGWIASLVWVCLRERPDNPPQPDARPQGSGVADRGGVLFKTLPWQRFGTQRAFDYIALSRSPNVTPPASDELVPVVEAYMRQI